MKPVDIRVINTMRKHGSMTPATLESLDVCIANTASQSMRRLARHGFAVRLSRGHYELSERCWHYVLGLNVQGDDTDRDRVPDDHGGV